MASDLKRQKIKNKQTKEKNKFRNKIFDFTFFKVLCLWASERAQGILYKA